MGVGAYDGSYFAPDDGIADAPFPPTLANVRPVPPGEPVNINGRICFAQTYIVPSEAGGTRPITVNRC